MLRAYPMSFIPGYSLPQSNVGISTTVPCMSDTQAINIFAHDYALDIDRQTLSIDWGISGFVERNHLTHHSHNRFEHCLFDQPVDVYFGGEAAPNKVFSYNPNKIPVDPTQGPAYIQDLSSFWTVHELHPSAHAADSYTFNVLTFAIDPATNTSVNISQFALAKLFGWFAVSSNDTKATTRFIRHTTVGSMTKVEPHLLAVEIKRSGWARIFNMCIFATNWILTVGAVHFLWDCGSGWVTVMAATLRISGVLVIATIRNLYIGTPPFGPFLDAAGFFSQITIIVLSSMVWLYDPSRLRVFGAASRKIEKA